MRSLAAAIIALAMMLAAPAGAVEPDEMLDDPALEERARKLSAQLRCMICQNQTIDDSDADIAKDLRILVRERLKAGDSDESVIAFLVDRYGEFVLLKPTFAPHTLVLWFAAPLVLLLGLAGMVIAVRRRRAAADPAQGLTAEEAAELERILSPGEDGDRPGAG